MLGTEIAILPCMTWPPSMPPEKPQSLWSPVHFPFIDKDNKLCSFVYKEVWKNLIQKGRQKLVFTSLSKA